MRARGMTVGMAVLAALAALAGAPAGAQEGARELVDWAPRWKKGDWWVVRTYQKDLKAEMESKAPAEGGTPAAPPNPMADPLPGYPPLEDGVPKGWKVGNRFRFEALRKELVKYPDDAPEDAPETFLVVGVKSLEGEPRTAEVWFAEADLTIAKVVTGPGTKAARTWELSGTAQLGPAPAEVLGVPLDWPDFKAAKEAEKELTLPGRGKVEQKVRTVAAGTPQEEQQIRLAEVVEKPSQPRQRVLMSFKRGAPFWTRLVGTSSMAELVEQGR
jgi:hypothetical protein